MLSIPKPGILLWGKGTTLSDAFGCSVKFPPPAPTSPLSFSASPSQGKIFPETVHMRAGDPSGVKTDRRDAHNDTTIETSFAVQVGEKIVQK